MYTPRACRDPFYIICHLSDRPAAMLTHDHAGRAVHRFVSRVNIKLLLLILDHTACLPGQFACRLRQLATAHMDSVANIAQLLPKCL